MVQMTYGHKTSLMRAKQLKKISVKQCFSSMHLQALIPEHQAPETLQGGRFHKGLEMSHTIHSLKRLTVHIREAKPLKSPVVKKLA